MQSKLPWIIRLLAISSVLSCSPSNTSLVKISLGEDWIDGNKMPVQIRMHSGLGNESYCTGSFISSKHLLTAAHCFKSVFTHMQVILGTNKLFDFEARSLTISMHPDWNSKSGASDLAIIEFPNAISGTTPFAISNRFPSEKEVVKIAGYGSESQLIGLYFIKNEDGSKFPVLPTDDRSNVQILGDWENEVRTPKGALYLNTIEYGEERLRVGTASIFSLSNEFIILKGAFGVPSDFESNDRLFLNGDEVDECPTSEVCFATVDSIHPKIHIDTSSESSAGSGDSGSPLLDSEGSVVGICSKGGIDEEDLEGGRKILRRRSTYVNLLSSSNRTFIQNYASHEVDK